MKTSLFLLKKYWFAHKKAAVAILFSVIVLVASLVCSFLSEIMEQRREINSRYDTYGHYSFVFSDPTADTENELKRLKNEGIINFGEVTVTGKIGDGSDKFAVGYLDKTAEYLLHYPVKKGRLPEKENEIAISELLMPHLGLLSEVGDTVKLPFTDSNGTITEKEFLLCGIFAADNLRNDTELTSAKTTRNDLKTPTPLVITGKNDYTPLYKNLLVTNTDIHSESEWLSFFYGTNYSYREDARITTGKENIAKLPFTTFDDTGKKAEKNEKIETVKILELLGILIALVAIISTFSAVFSVISNRINDFQLLKCVGYSKKSLLKMFIIECFLFLIAGIILGLICGCGLYEIVFLFQIKFMNLAPYSGFFPEPIIREITISPYILPIIIAAAVMIIAYIYPSIKIYKLSAVETKTSNIRKNKKTSEKINTLFSRIIGGKGVAIIQCSALIIVMCTSIFGYLYYTNNNKKNTDIIMDIVSNYAYSASDYKIGELDMKTNYIDCYIEAKSTYVFDGNAVMENQGGLKQSQIDAMTAEFDSVYADGRYLINPILYQNEDNVPQNLRGFIDPLNPNYAHYEDYIGKAILKTDMKFLNNSLMEKLKPYLTEGTLDGVVSINFNYNLNYKVGDTIPFTSQLSDENGKEIYESVKNFEGKVSGTVVLPPDGSWQQDSYLKSVFVEDMGYLTLAMTAQTATDLGFYNAEYFNVYVTGESDKSVIKLFLNETNKVTLTTQADLKKAAFLADLKAYTTISIIFALLLLICFVGYYNTQNLKITLNTNKFRNLRLLGLSMKNLKRKIAVNALKIPAIAYVLTSLFTIIFQKIMSSNYAEYKELFMKQQKLYSGIDNIYEASGFFMPLLSEFEEGTELYNITEKMDSLKENYMLSKEMWLPNVVIPLLIIGAIIMILTTISVAISMKNLSARTALEEKDD